MLLVSEGAKLSAREKRKDTPLWLALRNNRKETIDGLLSCDGAVDTCDLTGQDGFKHIDVAIRRCNTECLGTVLLHEATASPMRIYGLKAMIKNGRTWKPGDAELFDRVLKSIPERHLSILDLDELVHMFPETENSGLHQAWDSRRHDLKALGEDPWALHFLAQLGDTSTLKQLLEAGANASRLDKDNWMPSEIAHRYGHRASEDLLREHLAKGGAESLEEPSHRVPATFRDVYHEFDLKPSSNGNGLRRKQIEFSGTFRDTGLTHAVFRTQECIPPNVGEYSFMARLAEMWNTCPFYIGFCNAGLPHGKLPGTYPGSWSYEHEPRGGKFTAWALGEKEAQSHTVSVNESAEHLACIVFDKHKFLHGKIYPCVAFSPRYYGDRLESDVTLPALEEGRLVIEQHFHRRY
ncbi:hypothetical protein CEP53_008514 [Fusarium sp. AF-6]|nr:hypothetical protein CEP53_008514 [Fusarium sp. AF-6]